MSHQGELTVGSLSVITVDAGLELALVEVGGVWAPTPSKVGVSVAACCGGKALG
jgi:hypothetical protein